MAQEGPPVPSAGPKADWPTALALVFGAALPSLMAWLYFLHPAGAGGPAWLRQAVYGGGKVIQFVFPLAFALWWERRPPRLRWPSKDGLALGLVFGLAVAAGMFGLYFGWLRDSPLLKDTPVQLRDKLRGFGVASAPAFVTMAALLAVGNTLCEEYYFRWFLFGRMRAFLPLPAALVLGGLAFMAHHVLLLIAYLPNQFWNAVVPLSLCIAVGGGLWAWLYDRTGALYAPWLSHALVDAALFAIGWDLLKRAG